jgi:hypothetical protein
MANIQVKNIPEKLHNRLRRYAREQDCTLGEIVPMTHLGISAAQLLEQERRQRDSDLR